MSTAITTTERDDALAFIDQPSPEALQAALAEGQIQKLSTEQRLNFLAATCRSVGLNPLTRPFEFITLQGKMTMYARKDATDQLRKLHNVSIRIMSREQVGDVLVVTAQASLPNGRQDESIGAVPFGSLRGEAAAMAAMKAETKAKRRVTLSICGLGFMDESEIETAQAADHHHMQEVRMPESETVIQQTPNYDAAQDPAPAIETEIVQPEAEAPAIDPDADFVLDLMAMVDEADTPADLNGLIDQSKQLAKSNSDKVARKIMARAKTLNLNLNKTTKRYEQ